MVFEPELTTKDRLIGIFGKESGNTGEVVDQGQAKDEVVVPIPEVKGWQGIVVRQLTQGGTAKEGNQSLGKYHCSSTGPSLVSLVQMARTSKYLGQVPTT